MYTQNKYRKTYTREFKLLIVDKYLNEGKTGPQLSVEYELEISIIKDWIRKFRLYGASGLEDGRGKHNNHSSHGRPKKERFNSEVEALRHENMRLKGELFLLKKLKELRDKQEK